MGDIFQYEDDVADYPVRNPWQRSLVKYFWNCSGGDDLLVRTLYFIKCSEADQRLIRVEHDCNRFYRFNKTLLSNELAKVKSMTNRKKYFKKLFEINHYMLLFNVAVMLYNDMYREHVVDPDDLIMFLLKMFDKK